MKQLKVITCTFAGILVFCLFFHLYTHITASNTKAVCAELYSVEDRSAYLDSLYRLKENTLDYVNIWNVMINHAETSSIMALITTSIAYAENGDMATSKVSIKQTENAIDKMLDREKLMFSNVF